MRWIVRENKGVGDELKRAFQKGEISLEDIEVIRVWVRQVEGFGPESLRKTWRLKEASLPYVDAPLKRVNSEVNFWNDHELAGVWSGCRSSSFSRMGRIIYKIEDQRIRIVKVVKITGTHSY